MQPPDTVCGSLNVKPDDTTWVADVLGPQKAAGVLSQLYTWTPPPSAQRELPPATTLVLRCATFPDGVRRFYPTLSFDTFIDVAFNAGLGIWSELESKTGEHRQSERLKWFLFRRVRVTREHLTNVLLNPESLRVRTCGQGVEKIYSILPEDVGLYASHKEREGWCMAELLKEGREEAQERGVNKPTSSDLIHYGLLRAAQRNPLEVSDREVPGLLRQALYDTVMLPDYEACRPKPVYDTATRDAVIERVWNAILRHLEEPASEFDSWFQGPNNSFIAQIAKKKRAPGGALDPEVVRQILLDLGWEAYPRVGGLVDATMRTIFHLIDPPLNMLENEFYQQYYLKQPHFGEVPFVLWVERFPFLDESLWEMWTNPGDRQKVAVFHRLLYYYGAMAIERRSIDRLMSAKKASRGKNSPYVQEVSFDLDQHDSPASPTHQEIEELAEEVRDRNQVRCKCVTPLRPDWASEVSDFKDKEVTITHTCRTCDTTVTTILSLEKLKALADAPDVP
jgi:hypothetical protein